MHKINIPWFTIILLLLPVTLQSADYYWVGGAGNWSDTNHWATTSGGNDFHSQPPTKRDNVFFDPNSFNGAGQAVTIDVDDAVCGNMDWSGATGTPQLNGSTARTLRVYGSLTLISDMQFNFQGDFRFESDALSPFIRTITSAGQVFPAAIIFEGDDGQWALADPLEVRRNINLSRGTLTTDSQPITCESFISDNSFSRRLDLRRSTVRLRRTDADTVRWSVRADNFTMEARNATIRFLDPARMDNLGNGFLEYRTLEFQGDGILDCENLVSCRVDSMQLRRNAALLNDMTILNLQLSRNFEYRFASNKTFIIRTLLAEGGCEGYVSLRSTIDGEAALIQSAFGFMNNYLILRDIHNAGITDFIADNSIDLGNNDGWQINEPAPRTLYWVNDGGEWYDSDHWSLSSGGPGGECPPSPLDDVFFDANSYSNPAQVTMGPEGPNYYCHDMTWLDVTGTPSLDIDNLQLFGSLAFANDMEVELPLLHLRGDESGKNLASRGHALQTIQIEGGSDWTMQDPLTANLLEHFRGTFSTNSFELNLGRYSALQAEPPKTLNLSNSQVILNSPGLDTATWNINNANLTLDAGTSTIRLLHPEARFLTDVIGGITAAYNDVLFEATDGSVILESTGDAVSFQRAQFTGNATILGNNEFGTLLFSGGHEYVLQSGATQTILNRWEMAGNPCGVISLSATQPGSRAVARSNNAVIVASYVNMSDQRAEGNADFDAGLGSRNIGNNSGWTFPDGGSGDPGSFLGDDQVICTPSITLDPGISDQGQTYDWSTGATTPTIDVVQPGNYFVEISFPGDCRIQDTIDIFSQDILRAGFPSDTTLCSGETLQLNATSTAPDVSYQWQDGSTQPTFTVQSSGRYEVVVRSGNCSQASVVEVDVIDVPEVDLGPDREFCAGRSIPIDATVNGADAYLWNTGATTASIQVSQSGTYWVQANVDRCTRSDTLNISFKPLPTVDLGPDRELCEGEALTLDATTAGADYDWNTGAASATIEVAQSGTYSVVVDLDGCTASDEVNATFKPLPQIDLGDDIQACEGESVTLDATSANGADDYLWDNGAGTPTIQVAQPGTFSVEATLDGCSASDAVQVTFNPLPTVDLGPDRELCEGEALTLDATTAGADYDWNTGATSAAIEVAQSGTYSVVVDLDGCTASDEVNATFKPLPQIDLGDDIQACEGESITLDATSANGADDYLWDNGAGTPTIQVAQPGTFSVEATLDGCSASDAVQVTFNPLPTVDLGPDRELCEGETLTLDASTAGAGYDWNTGATSAAIDVAQSGTYSVVVDLDGCTASDEMNATFKPLPQIDLDDDIRACEGETVTLDGTSANGADTYRWNTGATTPTIQVSQSGNFTLEAGLDGCTRSEMVEITYITFPDDLLGANRQSCQGETVDLDATVPYDDAVYQWNTGSDDRQLRVTQSGNYQVNIEVAGCTTTDQVNVVFNPVPSFDLGEDAFLCEGDTYDLFIPVNGDSYRWNDGSIKEELTVRFPGGLVWGEVSRDGCSFRDSVQVNYQPAPQVSLGADTSICAERPLTLRSGTNTGNLVWNTGATTSSIEVVSPGTYWVEVQDGVCTARDSIDIDIRNCVFFDTYIPNAFSPNGDGVNDRFHPFLPADLQINSYRFAVFDRWGNQVFETNNPNEAWDGTHRGQELPQGVYVYFVELNFIDDDGPDERIQSGDVALLR